MSRDTHKKTAWLVIDETGSEGDDDFANKEEDSDSGYKLKYRLSKVAAKERDKDKVVVVDLDKPNFEANTNDKDKVTNSRTAVTRKRERGYSSKSNVKEEEKSSESDVTFIRTSAIVIDDEDNQDIKIQTSVPQKTRKRKDSIETVNAEKVKSTQASSSKKKLAIDKFNDNEKEDSDSVVKYQPSRKTARQDKDVMKHKASNKDKDVKANTSTIATKVEKKGFNGKADVREEHRSLGTNDIQIIIDDDADDEHIKVETKVPDKRTKRKGSIVKTATKKAKIVRASSSKQIFEVDNSGSDKLKGDKNEDSDDVVEYQPSKKVEKEDEDDEDIKVETKVSDKSTKRKGSNVKTATKKAKIIRASSSKQIFEVDNSGSDNLKGDKNEDSDDVVEYQPSKKVEKEDEDERSVIGFDKSNRKTRIKDTGLTSRSKLVAEVRKKEEEGSSYINVKLQSRSEITIDDEDDKDIKLEIKLLAKNTKRKGSNVTPAAKKAKTNKMPRAEEALKNNEGDKTDNFSGNADAEWSESDYLSEFNQIEPQIAANLISLFKNDNTLPFIARYRKEMTGGMEPEQLRNIKNTYDNLQLIKQRASKILKTIDKLGKWSPEIHSALAGAKTMNELDLIYAPYKAGSKGSLAERAKELGLASIGQTILQGRAIPPLFSLIDTTREGLKTENDVKQGIMHIIADVIHKDKTTFEGIRKLRKIAVINIETTKSKTASSSKTSKNDKYNNDLKKYEKYFNFKSSERIIKDYQILAINRGESQKILTVKIVIPEWFQRELMTHCLAKYNFVSKVSNFHHNIIQESFNDAYIRLIKPLIVRQVRHDLNERAESASIEVFARNLKKLLLSPPLRGKTILGIDPGFYHGCKLAVISQSGNVLDTATIYPHTKSKSNSEQHVQVLAHLIKKYSCTIVAIGNGTACRETETFLTDLIQAGVFAPLDVSYTIVNEAGASIYSCSSDAKSEFPDLDPNIISAISIARRLQDPLAELIKIDPKHLGIGMYQLDLPKKQLQLTLDEVITETVSFVGVDINTASHCLLTKVAGLSAIRATNIIKLRDELGSFSNRQELLKVKGIGNSCFVQCAGFIRILPETASTGNKMLSKKLDYLDQTWIHPESYDVARQFLKACKCDLNQLGSESFIEKVSSYANGNYKTLADKFGTSEQSMEIIVKGLLMKKGEDIRVDEEAPLFQRNLRCIDDLSVNTILTGSVRNVTNFGAFVDIGVGTNGLIPNGKMQRQILSLGQKVEVVVLDIDKNRNRVTLSLIDNKVSNDHYVSSSDSNI